MGRRGIEQTIDGEGLVERCPACFLKAPRLCEVAGLRGDVADRAILAEGMGASGHRVKFIMFILTNCT